MIFQLRKLKCSDAIIVTIIKMRYRKHARKLIKNCINAAEVYKILEKNLVSKT